MIINDNTKQKGQREAGYASTNTRSPNMLSDWKLEMRSYEEAAI